MAWMRKPPRNHPNDDRRTSCTPWSAWSAWGSPGCGRRRVEPRHEPLQDRQRPPNSLENVAKAVYALGSIWALAVALVLLVTRQVASRGTARSPARRVGRRRGPQRDLPAHTIRARGQRAGRRRPGFPVVNVAIITAWPRARAVPRAPAPADSSLLVLLVASRRCTWAPGSRPTCSAASSGLRRWRRGAGRVRFARRSADRRGGTRRAHRHRVRGRRHARDEERVARASVMDVELTRRAAARRRVRSRPARRAVIAKVWHGPCTTIPACPCSAVGSNRWSTSATR